MITAKASEKRTARAKADVEQRHAYNAIRFMEGTLQAKADFLNKEKYTTPQGKPFTRIQVDRLIKKFAE